MRAPAAALAAFLLAIGIAACGGGSSSSSTASTAAPSAASTTATTTPPPPAGANPAGKAAANPAAGETGGKTSRPSPPSGPAAAFHTPHGDNSIPNYGAEAPASQRADATAALRAYLEARANGDWSAACANTGRLARAQLETLAKASKGKAQGCERAYATLSAYGPPSERANPLVSGLAAFRVKGKKAFALFYGPRNQKYMVPMVREGSAWKVNQIAPIPYPIGAPTPP